MLASRLINRERITNCVHLDTFFGAAKPILKQNTISERVKSESSLITSPAQVIEAQPQKTEEKQLPAPIEGTITINKSLAPSSTPTIIKSAPSLGLNHPEVTSNKQNTISEVVKSESSLITPAQVIEDQSQKTEEKQLPAPIDNLLFTFLFIIIILIMLKMFRSNYQINIVKHKKNQLKN